MKIVVLVSILLFSVTVKAVTIDDLTDVSVQVEDQGISNRADAIAGAFQKVIVKMSGTRDSLLNPILQREQGRVESYVSSMRYERDAETGALALNVTFMAPPLQALLEKAGAPQWSNSRPQTVFWLVSQEGSGREVITRDNAFWAPILSAAMHERGVPMIFPSWDLDDELALGIPQLWGLFEQDINRANQRYSADGYLAGRLLQPRSNAWQFDGYVSYGSERTSLNISEESPERLAASIADGLATLLSSRYAVVAIPEGEGAGHVIRVSQVTSFLAYRQLQDYLKEHVTIRNFSLMGIEGDQAIISLELASSWGQVWDVLSLDQKLHATEQADVFSWPP